MDYSFDKVDGIDVLSVKGNVLTGVHNSDITQNISDMIANGSKGIVVQLGEVGFINSNGLNLLLNILTKYRKSGGEIVLSNVPGELNRLLVMTKLNSIFIDRPTVAEAAQYLKNL